MHCMFLLCERGRDFGGITQLLCIRSKNVMEERNQVLLGVLVYEFDQLWSGWGWGRPLGGGMRNVCFLSRFNCTIIST
jgi:hypothetical protein